MCLDNAAYSFGIPSLLSQSIRWVVEVPTQDNGLTRLKIPFKDLEPAIRAKPVPFPLKFDASKISQFQLLYSKFGKPGKLNRGFQPGQIRILFHSISAYT